MVGSIDNGHVDNPTDAMNLSRGIEVVLLGTVQLAVHAIR